MKTIGAALLAAALVTGMLSTPSATPAVTAAAHHQSAPLTNLAHLDFLTASVAVPATAAHSTYRLADQPKVGVLWVYADPRAGGTFQRIGGGAYHAQTNTYGQGAYDADDIARAAVVYLRQWKATGSTHAKEQAYQQLRGLSYLQTLTGPKAGEVVLWMQPDGSLNPTPTPADSPNPSDSDQSYWLARTLWALGEGYAAFRHSDPAFASFLAARMQLSVSALNRDTLDKYRHYQTIHGTKVPSWLIVDGADASSEAMLGLAAYVSAAGPESSTAKVALRKLSDGVAKMSAGSTTSWPYRAVLPWALSRSDWHAWGSQMGAGLAAASTALGNKSLLKPAIGDAAGFTPQLLTSTAAVNGLLPSPIDKTQIAYGADARVETLLGVGTASRRSGIRELAGIAAGWFFGANTAGAPVYNPATGVTFDGVQPDGTVNQGSGAESTIHGLLAMQVLDAHPDLAALARASATVSVRDGLTVVEAESGTLTGNAVVAQPESSWTGESQWSGSLVAAGAGSTVRWSLPSAGQPRLVQPVVELVRGSTARTAFSLGRHATSTLRYGKVGAQGNAPAAGMLVPVDLSLTAPAAATTVTARTIGGTGRIDNLLVMPQVASLVAAGNGGATALLTSKARCTQLRPVALAGTGRATVKSYDRNGRLLRTREVSGSSISAVVAPGGFTIVSR
ncbi:MAG: hypothetical protein M3Z00_13680 [Actinomycetota bacterium]|nr:hypothetical protein [Actinomycetota bacterium]